MASYTIATHIGTRDQSARDILIEMERIKAAFPHVRMEKVRVTPAEMQALRDYAKQWTGPMPGEPQALSVLGVQLVLEE